MGSRICPLLWQNCSMTLADSLAARVTIWYVFFTAVGSFSGFLSGNRILSKPAPPPPTNLQLYLGHNHPSRSRHVARDHLTGRSDSGAVSDRRPAIRATNAEGYTQAR